MPWPTCDARVTSVSRPDVAIARDLNGREEILTGPVEVTATWPYGHITFQVSPTYTPPALDDLVRVRIEWDS
jgi:hypothetical protein